MSTPRIAVIGLGRMGANHARVLSELPDISLAALCDANRESAAKAARKLLVERYYWEVDSLLSSETLDAVVVAVPTSEHLDVAERCIARGLHVLVEKPMASTVSECERMIEGSHRHKKLLMIGHVERFNPAILKIKEFLDQEFLGKVYCVETNRSGPFPRRLYGSKDGVVIDLAVHDLDLIAYLFGPLKQLYANHILTPDHKQDIHARVLLKTLSGIVGTSLFSWISPRRERSITIYGDNGILQGNLIEQEVWYYENGDVGIDYSDNYFQNVQMGRVSEGKIVKFPIKKEEPLRSELSSFLNLIRSGKDLDPSYGRDAVRYSLSVLESAENDKIIAF